MEEVHTKTNETNFKKPGEGQPGDGFIRMVNTSKSYVEGDRRRVILNEADLEIPKGEFLAILGKSGSGKTTMLNLLSGIDRVDSGNVFIDDLHLTKLSETDRTLFRRRHIGFIFQFFNLIPTLTVWENVILPLELNGLADREGLLRAEKLLDEVGLYHRRGAYPDRLSGGEQQRIAIARSVVHDPRILLADEPTGNLDEVTGKSVLQLLDRLTRGMGKNLVLVTHSREAANYADRVVNLKDGKLCEAC